MKREENRYRQAMESPVLRAAARAEEVFWLNPGKGKRELPPFNTPPVSEKDIEDAELRLRRFAPLIARCFPETREAGGLIESPLIPIPKMREALMGGRRRADKEYLFLEGGCLPLFEAGAEEGRAASEGRGGGTGDGKVLSVQLSSLEGAVFLKADSHLPIAGSVKARGGIYEVLKHTEELAVREGLILEGDSCEKLLSEECRRFFSRYTIQAGSTGNLGLSIGIMSAAIGYRTVIHMSADAKQWKKDLLRSHSVTVKEYKSDYSQAVREGRRLSDLDDHSYFVDDENSVSLFLGYATAAKRLKAQLERAGRAVDREHPLFVYLPCGVGGAPGGICFGLKQVFGENVYCFFAEPVQSPCMLAGMASGLHSKISVQDLGLTGRTHADGLAVGRPSGFVGAVMEPLLDGIFTVKDFRLYEYMRGLKQTEGIFIEPSACAAFPGPSLLAAAAGAVKKGMLGADREEPLEWAERGEGQCLGAYLAHSQEATHIVWATGGSLVPGPERENYLQTYLSEES